MIPFDPDDAAAVLRRTPDTLRALLSGLPERWLHVSEGAETFSPWEVVAHLLHGERTDWMLRLRIILEHGEARPFEPFDRFAHRTASAGATIDELLEQFAEARHANLAELASLLDTGNLDTENGAVVMRLLEDLHAAGATVCMVTHDEGCAAVAGRRLYMLDGEIQEPQVV